MFKSYYVEHTDKSGAKVSSRYVRAGQGEAVVLIHGVGMRSSVWLPQISDLSSGYDVLAVDMLGHGGSSLPREDNLCLEDYAAQVKAVLSHAGLEKAHIVGHSMGALVALEFALSRPRQVISVSALNAVFKRNPEQKKSVAERLAALEEEFDFGAQTLSRWFGKPVPEKWSLAADIVRSHLAEVNNEGYRRTYRLFALSDDVHEKRLPMLEAPALFLTGEDDSNSIPAMSRAMAGLCPNGRFDVVAGERHMMSLTAPQEISKRLSSFFEEASRSPKVECDLTDARSFRNALGAFPTGVTVLATMHNGEPRGFTANSFASVSLSPPLVSVCIAKSSSSQNAFFAANYFAVNVLAEHQSDLSTIFATKNANRFTSHAWKKSPFGSPILDGVSAWFDCRKYDWIDAGDHIILLGEVLAFRGTDLNPLGYCRGSHIKFGLPLSSKGSEWNGLRVGAILELEGRIFFRKNDRGRLELPEASSLGSSHNQPNLAALLKQSGIRADLNFLYAVFDDSVGNTFIIYRGTVVHADVSSEVGVFVPLEEIPWSLIDEAPTRSMLKRYEQERRNSSFGVYMGDDGKGVVQQLVRAAEDI